MQHVTIDNVLFRLGQTMGAHNFVVTRGRHGAVGYANPRPAFSIPAFAEHGIDTMGAGDAFLAVTAPLIAAGLGAEEVALVVTHDAVNRALLCRVLGLPLARVWTFRQASACLNLLEGTDLDHLQVVRINDASHLIPLFGEVVHRRL